MYWRRLSGLDKQGALAKTRVSLAGRMRDLPMPEKLKLFSTALTMPVSDASLIPHKKRGADWRPFSIRISVRT